MEASWVVIESWSSLYNSKWASLNVKLGLGPAYKLVVLSWNQY